jgi:hypothetical protein
LFLSPIPTDLSDAPGPETEDDVRSEVEGESEFWVSVDDDRDGARSFDKDSNGK